MPRGIYIRTLATREAIRRSRFGVKATPEARKNMKAAAQKLAKNFSWLKKVSETTKKAMHQDDIRQRHLEGLTRARKVHGINFKGGNGQQPVAFVRCLESILSPAGFIREYAIGVSGLIRNYKVDFAHIAGKIAIERDGPAHRPWAQRVKDQKKDKILKALGWRVIRVKHN